MQLWAHMSDPVRAVERMVMLWERMWRLAREEAQTGWPRLECASKLALPMVGPLARMLRRRAAAVLSALLWAREPPDLEPAAFLLVQPWVRMSRPCSAEVRRATLWVRMLLPWAAAAPTASVWVRMFSDLEPAVLRSAVPWVRMSRPYSAELRRAMRWAHRFYRPPQAAPTAHAWVSMLPLWGRPARPLD